MFSYVHKVVSNRSTSIHILLGLINFFLLHLEYNLEEVSHGHHHLARCLLRLDAKESVSILRRPVHIAESSVVSHVLGDETDLVHGMMIQTVLKRIKMYLKEVCTYVLNLPLTFHP